MALTRNAARRQAVCNDGTRSGYFMRQALDQNDQFNWLIYLQGGDWCYSQASCEQVRHAARERSGVARRRRVHCLLMPRRSAATQRANHSKIYMSSQDWPWEITLGGA